MEALYPCEFSDSLLFTSAKGKAIHYQRWRETHFDKAAAAVGLTGLTPHDLRRTYASLSIQAGVGPKALQAAMGHSDIRLTMDVYASLFEEDRDDHASRLSKAAEKAFSNKCTQNVRTLPKNKPEMWSRLGDSNSGPTHYKAPTDCAHPRSAISISFAQHFLVSKMKLVVQNKVSRLLPKSLM